MWGQNWDHRLYGNQTGLYQRTGRCRRQLLRSIGQSTFSPPPITLSSPWCCFLSSTPPPACCDSHTQYRIVLWRLPVSQQNIFSVCKVNLRFIGWLTQRRYACASLSTSFNSTFTSGTHRSGRTHLQASFVAQMLKRHLFCSSTTMSVNHWHDNPNMMMRHSDPSQLF